ncbi:LOW QUALITY PROTEIN: hypothetical protein PHMEG_00013456 [Phytophthora megakarya]|uniref:PiggyBac transposable element-derived protein domain-containing protein n=1 Tax=Phytophthora megakarya TaxID=4795 RepID=A0A225W8U2_9STRA|nr:LOW QUALITY PROTEIN: hypothetical protein PHMEG_00013456 [Phytophthora megakarya]
MDVIDNWRSVKGNDLLKLAKDKATLTRMSTEGWETYPAKFPTLQDFPGLHNVEGRPTSAALDCAVSPLELFLFSWLGVERETNRYYEQQLPVRMDFRFRSQSGTNTMTMENMLANEKAVYSRIRAHKILQCIDLLLARMLCPHIRRLSDHWAITSVGAIPAGTFGRFMKRERFERIMRNLHFSDSDAARVPTDKAWKVRPIVDTLQRMFLCGYTTPPLISSDEAMVCRYNTMRQFIKDKPHRWGMKLFMTCCAQSAYCLRLEVYCGQSDQDIPEDEEPADDNSGPSATLQNMNAVLPQKKKGVYYAVILHFDPDSSTASRAERLSGGYHPDQEERPSYDAETKHIEAPEGSTSRQWCQNQSAMVWFDNTIVYMLGLARSQGQKVTIPCPTAMKAYHQYMGGVDVHDQLRLQRYSLQLSLRFRKYYKSLALGLIDMAIVNCFIIFREVCKMRGDIQPITPVLLHNCTHSFWLSALQNLLIRYVFD